MPDWETLTPSVVFDVDDIDATCGRLAANGVTLEKELAQRPWAKFASFLDTEGNESDSGDDQLPALNGS